MAPIYLLVGVPGSGKTWVCKQLQDKFDYLAHDDYMHSPLKAYVSAAARLAAFGDKPVLIKTPFSVSSLLEPLTAQGVHVRPVFIIEDPETVSQRYTQREGRPIPQGHITRIRTYIERAKTLRAFSGTSDEVLEYLRNAA